MRDLPFNDNMEFIDDDLLFSQKFIESWILHKEQIFAIVGSEMAVQEEKDEQESESRSPPPSSSSLNLKNVFRSISPGPAPADGKTLLRELVDRIGSDLRLHAVFSDITNANQFLIDLMQDG